MELKRYVLVLKNNYRNKFIDEIDLIDTKDDLLQEKLSKYTHEAKTGYTRWYGYTTRKTRKNSKETYLAYNDGGRYQDENVDMVGKIIKTSDNIFDFVEVGDLVEIESSVYLHRVYEQIYKGLNNQVLPYIYMNVHSESQYPLKDVNREVITAIYKRQQNGDYKRYEVKA